MFRDLQILLDIGLGVIPGVMIWTLSNRLFNTEVKKDLYNYSYDLKGNMLVMLHLDAMQWNLNNELYQIQNGILEAFYQYSSGQRVRKYIDREYKRRANLFRKL